MPHALSQSSNIEPENSPNINPPELLTENPENSGGTPGEPAIDLTAADDELICESVFCCQDVIEFSAEEPIHDWMTFQPGTASHDICLVEDEMPLLDEPLERSEEQCFMLEIPMSCQDVLRWQC